MKQLFINLAVTDVEKSMAFYTAIGFRNNPQFSDETAKCMIWADNIFLMLLSKEKFKTFINKPLAETKAHVAGLYALSFESTEQVHATLEAGLAVGGIEPMPAQDHGFMLTRQLEDYDGHTWEIFHMNMEAMGQ
jgi:uncharacterized protein